MAWQDVEVDLGGSRRGRVLWSVTLKQGGARITVPNAVLEVLGWTQHAALKLQVGSGEQSASIRLVADSKGPIRATKPYANAKSLQYRLGIWQGMPRDQEQVAVRHEALDGTLVLHLPAVVKATTQAAAKTIAPPPPADRDNTRGKAARPVASIMSGPPPQRPVTGKIDVTSKSFDDPKRPVQMASGVRGGRS